jgi:UDP-perosamine 4-acetyltransferase
MTIQVILVGGGGHARVVLESLSHEGTEVLGFVDRHRPDEGALDGLAYLGDEDDLESFLDQPEIRLINCVGSVGDARAHTRVFDDLKARGHLFHTLVHPRAIVASGVPVGEGTQVMAGAIIQPGSSIGANVLINTGAQVDHDCSVGDHTHVAPGAILSGGVALGARAHVGTGAVILQLRTIGDDATVGAGAVVLEDVPTGVTVVGVPAKAIVR